MASSYYSYFHFSTKEYIVGLSKVNRKVCKNAQKTSLRTFHFSVPGD